MLRRWELRQLYGHSNELPTGDPSAAIDVLGHTTQYDLAGHTAFTGMYPAYIRGLAYLHRGDGRRAAAEFQKLLGHRGLMGYSVTGALSILQIARAQTLMGDVSAAQASYVRFLRLWKDADSDIPIYQKAKAEYEKLTKTLASDSPTTARPSR